MDDYKNLKNDEEKSEESYRFVKEVIKKKAVRPRDVLMRIGCIAGGAVLFGLIAAFVFVRFLPVFQQEEEVAAAPIDFEEDHPGEAKVTPEPEATPTPTQTPDALVGIHQQEQESPVIAYSEIYNEMQNIAQKEMRSIVTVTGITATEDWFNVQSESSKQASGVIIANSNQELYILTEYSAIDSVERIVVTFNDGAIADGRYQMHDPNTGLTILRVAVADLETETKASMAVAELGNSYSVSQGEAVIAVGSPMGYSDSVVYGQITSTTNTVSTYDEQYNLFTTNMLGNSEGSGVIINLEGQIISVISQKFGQEGHENIIVGLPISQLKSLIEILSNEGELPYIGIKGQNVTDEVVNQTGMPKGVYVSSMNSDSPAFNTGIRNGDIIVKYDGEPVGTMSQYTEHLMKTTPGAVVDLTIMRMSTEGYREFEFKIATESR